MQLSILHLTGHTAAEIGPIWLDVLIQGPQDAPHI